MKKLIILLMVLAISLAGIAQPNLSDSTTRKDPSHRAHHSHHNKKHFRIFPFRHHHKGKSHDKHEKDSHERKHGHGHHGDH